MQTLMAFAMRAGLQSLVMFMLVHGLTDAQTSTLMVRLARDGVALVGLLLMKATVG